MPHPLELLKDSRSLVDLLAKRAQVTGFRPLYQFLNFGEEASSEQQISAVTYAEMHQRAQAVGGWLQDYAQTKGLPIVGMRVLLVFPPGLDYLSAYFGCLYAGAIAVPAYPPRRNRRADRLRSIVRDAGLSLVLAPGDLIGQLQETIEADDVLCRLDWQSVEAIPGTAAQSWREPQIDRSTIAFLQYTSGSTGDPKGVVVTHGNLLHNQSLIRAHFGTQRRSSDQPPIALDWEQPLDQTETVVGWLPLHHDMGLIGNVLHPLYVGGRLIFMAPIDFLQKPIRWLEAISKYGATISGGPNFAYRLCADEVSIDQCDGLDLSRWKVAFNGAEPIDADVLRRFASKFSVCGFDYNSFVPCYGMAETTLLVTSSTCGAEPVVDQSTGDVVGCGKIDPAEMDVRIVNPETCVEVEPGNEGEIWVSGESVAAGYWEKAELTESTFAAQLHGLQTQNANQRFLRTGDLGYQRDGQLFVTSRLKDLIIVRGVNHYPQDIERTVEQAHAALQTGGCAAFSVSLEGEERVVVVQEVRRTELRSLDPSAVTQTVVRTVLDSHEIRLASVVLIRPGGLPKTTSGKVQRREARRMFLADEFKAVGTWKAASMLQTFDSDPVSEVQRRLRAWLTAKIAARLKLAPSALDQHQPLAHYGLDSLSAVRLAGEVSDYLGRAVPPTLAYEFPTIAALAAHLAGDDADSCDPSSKDCQTLSSSTQVVAGPLDGTGAMTGVGPIAVIGIGCRLPGASSATQFWELLKSGRCAVGECVDPAQDREFTFGDKVPRRAGYITDIDKFDAAFFAINAREADALDPQQRLLLEVTWQALEDAELPVERLSGKSVGVFVGAGNSDYSRLVSRTSCARGNAATGDATTGNGYAATGNSLAMAANRISYTFDFRGPSFTIDTACSSSLVAIHQALRSLRARECEAAIVGGVNLILSDQTTAEFERAGMLSSDSVCRAFAQGANGFVRGEGCAVVILKPLEQAQADGNRVYAVLKGSAINQDGRTNGLTAPSRQAQQSLISDALRDAKVLPEDVDYVEAHGTGTELGDPIEMRAIRGALAAETRQAAKQHSLMVGSVKTNIGHLEAAAGIAGLIKVCLSLKFGQIAPSLHFATPSPHIDFGGVHVPTSLTAWPRPSHAARPAVAGVSSFGFGGANAHVIVEEYPTREVGPSETADQTSHLLLCSARSQPALDELVKQISSFAEDQGQLVSPPQYAQRLSRAAHTLAVGRSHHRFRAARVLRSDEAVVRSDAVAHGPNGNSGPAASPPVTAETWLQGIANSDPQSAWLFSGQGGTFPSAGQQLADQHAIFRNYFSQAAETCAAVTRLDPRDILWGQAEHWLGVQIQPALFALQWSLAQTYRAIGIEPSVVGGHSLGEYGAACVAGVFSFEDGLRIVAKRAELTAGLEIRGGMLAVFADESTVVRTLADARIAADIAAINGPRQTVLAGTNEMLQQLVHVFKSQNVPTRLMQTSHGFHSCLIDPILDQFEEFVGSIPLKRPTLKFLSSQCGQVLQGDQLNRVATAEYWRDNLRQPVRFYDSLLSLRGLQNPAAAGPVEAGSRSELTSEFVNIELGAGSTLTSIMRASKLGLRSLPGLASNVNEHALFMENLASLYVAGFNFRWQSALGLRSTADRGPSIGLPYYPFERERYWYGQHLSGTAPVKREAQHQDPQGQWIPVSSDDLIYQFQWDATGYLRDHVVAGTVVLPAAAILGLADHARESLEPGLGLKTTDDLKILKPLVLDAAQPAICQVVISRVARRWQAKLACKRQSSWTIHATWTYQHQDFAEAAEYRRYSVGDGSVGDGSVGDGSQARPESAMTASEVDRLDVDQFYQQCAKVGLQYGPAFRVIELLERVGGEARGICRLQHRFIDNSQGKSQHFSTLHPTLLDGCLQVIGATQGNWGERTWLPIGCDSYWLSDRVYESCGSHASGEETVLGECLVVASVRNASPLSLEYADDLRVADVVVRSLTGETLATLTGVQLQATNALQVDDLLYEEVWVPQMRIREIRGSFADLENAPFINTCAMADSIALEQPFSLVELLDELEDVAGKSVIYIFQQLGFEFCGQSSFTEESLANQLRIVPQHRRLLRRMLGILAELEIIRCAGGQSAAAAWTVMRDVSSVPLESLFDQARAKFPEGAAEFQLLERCVLNAGCCLNSGQDPLLLLFPADGSVSAAQVYRDSAGGRLMNQLVHSAVEELAARLPAGRGLRVLEIGAGTGATTESVLAALPQGRVSYCFTDVSGSFLAAARERFGHLSEIDFQILDIEQAPKDELLGSYDLVIAANVLHATTDISKSLDHARAMLTEGGFLLAVDGTVPIRWMDLTFGLTSGWWRFADTELRPQYPLLTADTWRQVLCQLQFTDSLIIAPRLKLNSAREAENSLILARKPASVKNSAASQPDLVTAVANQQSRSFLVMDQPGSGSTSVQDSLLLRALKSRLPNTGPSPTDVVMVMPEVADGDDLSLAVNIQCNSLELLRQLQAVVKRIEQQQSEQASGQSLKVWLITSGAQSCGRGSETMPATRLSHGTALGMWRTFALEQSSAKCVNIDLDPLADITSQVETAVDEILAGAEDNEAEVAFRSHARYVRRLDRVATQGLERHQQYESLKLESRGSLDGLKLCTVDRRAPGANEVEIEVKAAGLNFRDVLNVLDLYPGRVALGAECVGVVRRVGCNVTHLAPGQPVAALAADTFAQYVYCAAEAVVPIPDGLSFEQAATIPVAYLTAAIGLIDLANLKAGQTVLIHSAAGGVGMAATKIAVARGARVIATASLRKHDLLKSCGIEFIYDSRSPEFAQRALDVTAGRGVDVVLNSLDESRVAENLKALAKFGRYVDITIPNERVRQRVAEHDNRIVYHALDLAHLITRYPSDMANRLAEIFRQVACGTFEPIPAKVYSLGDYQSAFRQMRDGTSTGKLILCPSAKTKPSANGILRAGEDQITPDKEGWQLITGGLGGLGLLLARDLLSQGYQRLALIARRPASEVEQRTLAALRASGGIVELIVADVQDFFAMSVATGRLRESHPTISGVFHLAGQLDDATIANQTEQSFKNVFGGKVIGAWNLHVLTSSDSLSHFVLYSSASSVLGSPGQANHAAGNAFLDILAQYRKSRRLPALSINWGPWAEIGAAATLALQNRTDFAGIGMLDPCEGSSLLRTILRAPSMNIPTQLLAMKIDAVRLTHRRSESRIFEKLQRQEQTLKSHSDTLELQDRLNRASKAERCVILSEYVRQAVARTLGKRDSTAIHLDQPFFEMGMDSLTSLELANSLKSSLGIAVSTNEFFNFPTVQKLAARLTAMWEQSSGNAGLENSDSAASNLSTQHVGTITTNASDTANWGASEEVSALLREIGALSSDLDGWEANR